MDTSMGLLGLSCMGRNISNDGSEQPINGIRNGINSIFSSINTVYIFKR